MTDFSIRHANLDDVPLIVAMLADDALGQHRETARSPTSYAPYIKAFERISQDSNQHLIVVESGAGELVGTLQLTFLPYLTHQGGLRAQIEAVRVKRGYRRQGIGRYLFEWAITQAREEGACMVQLTTDRKRPEAVAFYESLGFSFTHHGMKLFL